MLLLDPRPSGGPFRNGLCFWEERGRRVLLPPRITQGCRSFHHEGTTAEKRRPQGLKGYREAERKRLTWVSALRGPGPGLGVHAFWWPCDYWGDIILSLFPCACSDFAPLLYGSLIHIAKGD